MMMMMMMMMFKGKTLTELTDLTDCRLMKNDEKREFLTFCVSLSLFLSSTVSSVLDFLIFFAIEKFNISTHTREKRKEETFSHPPLHTHLLHTQKTLKTHKRERDSFVVLVPHARVSHSFDSFSLSLSLSLFF